MGVINGSSLSMIKSNDGFCISPSLNKTHFAVSKYQKQFNCVASVSSVEQQVKLSGDSFIRPHLRELSPYQPILPFERMGIWTFWFKLKVCRDGNRAGLVILVSCLIRKLCL
ncbi:putative histidinol-phosphate transaminase [Helianthus annuus]|nr:putative histidinol-phosphate transaminase [Helianthus annuus]